MLVNRKHECHNSNQWGWPEPYVYTVYDRVYGKFPAKNTVYTPCICMYVWFWPTLQISFQLTGHSPSSSVVHCRFSSFRQLYLKYSTHTWTRTRTHTLSHTHTHTHTHTHNHTPTLTWYGTHVQSGARCGPCRSAHIGSWPDLLQRHGACLFQTGAGPVRVSVRVCTCSVLSPLWSSIKGTNNQILQQALVDALKWGAAFFL